jgi:hypothetical protein
MPGGSFQRHQYGSDSLGFVPVLSIESELFPSFNFLRDLILFLFSYFLLLSYLPLDAGVRAGPF